MQGTINGFGERCGNLNLCSVLPNLQLKQGYKCVRASQLRRLREISHLVYELANVVPAKRQPYVGESAFAHKGGLHVSGIIKNRETYEHIEPELVGSRQRVLVSDLSGRSNIVYKAREYDIDLNGQDQAVHQILNRIKELESQGYEFEAAEASFELLIQEALGRKKRNFRLDGFRVIDEKRVENEPPLSEATVKVEVNGVDGARRGPGQRAGARAGPRPAQGADGVLPFPGGSGAAGLQGPGAVVRGGHRRLGPGAHRVGRRPQPVGHGGSVP